MTLQTQEDVDQLLERVKATNQQIDDDRAEHDPDEHPFGPDYNSRGPDYDALDRRDGIR